MFDYIKGEITIIGANYIVLENNNIGFKIFTPIPYSFKVGEKLCIYTYTFVREENFDLYGFRTKDEKDIFIFDYFPNNRNRSFKCSEGEKVLCIWYRLLQSGKSL